MIYDGLELGNMVLAELVLGRAWSGDLERGIALAGGSNRNSFSRSVCFVSRSSAGFLK